jgi:hypothetical protein
MKFAKEKLLKSLVNNLVIVFLVFIERAYEFSSPLVGVDGEG